MKIHRLLEDYLHGQIRKSSGDWDDVANVPDITDTFTKDNQNPFDRDFWQEKMHNTPKVEKTNKETEKNKLNIIV